MICIYARAISVSLSSSKWESDAQGRQPLHGGQTQRVVPNAQPFVDDMKCPPAHGVVLGPRDRLVRRTVRVLRRGELDDVVGELVWSEERKTEVASVSL